MYDAIVVGGGIVGMSTAYHLMCAGVKTLLIDRGDQGRATDAGAGIISPEMHGRGPEAWFQDRKSTRLNSSHSRASRMPSSA